MGIRNDTYLKYINLIKNYLDHVLEIGKKENDSKLILANGWNVKKQEPASWIFENGDKAYLSDLALQQNLLRILEGFSRLTCDQHYSDIAKKTFRTYFHYYQHECGLLHWGGHRFVDFQFGNVVGIRDKKGDVHELKECFPYYELMFQTDTEATARFIRSFWNAHVYQWKTLEINRHGYYETKGGRLWANEYEKAEPFREAAGLSFLNAASDLIYAAGELYLYKKEKGALIWMTRMVREYEKARDPRTGLGAYQFNRSRKISEAPSDEITLSKYGDRANRQLGMDYEQALEGRMLLAQQAYSLYYHSAVVWTKLGKQLGIFGKNLIDFAYTGLKSYTSYAYQKNNNTMKPLLTDGTSLLGYTLKKDGYYGKKGEILQEIPVDERFLYSYVIVYLEKPDQQLWDVIRNISIHLQAGDPGIRPGVQVSVDPTSVKNCSELAVMSYVELYHLTGCDDYLSLAITIADLMIENKYREGLFFRSTKSAFADFDSVCPLALLQLCGAIVHKKELIPEYMTGQAYIHGKYRFDNATTAPFTTKQMFQ